MKDALGHTMVYDHNARGNSITLTFDNAGRQKTIADQLGNKTTFNYDAAGRSGGQGEMVVFTLGSLETLSSGKASFAKQ